MAPLYHGTSLYSANKILKDDILIASKQGEGFTHGPQTGGKNVVFFTRSLEHAKYMGRVILVIDQEKLAQRYKISPIRNWPNSGGSKPMFMSHKAKYPGDTTYSNEFEEVVYSNIKNINNYVTKIYTPKGISLDSYSYLSSDDRVEEI